MSNHERVYEGTLNWPMMAQLAGLTCRAPANERLPPWGLSSDEPPPENPCAGLIIGTDYLTLGQIRDAVEGHMREAHGEQV